MHKTPRLIQKFFPNLIWQMNAKEKTIFLTFDDGPVPEVTSWVLNTLNRYQAQATFFCIGDNVSKHPDVYQEILTRNHIIGNHTFNHLKGWQTVSEDYLENTLKCEELIDNPDKWFRPPYGKITPKQIKTLKNEGYQIVMWDVLSYDFEEKLNTDLALKKIIKHTQSNSIVVFHDSLKAFDNLKKMLPPYLDYFSKKGYVFRGLNHNL
jgi:peptidoglycan/xylan/chitin deacetylase (PgdA/CDA1 family)